VALFSEFVIGGQSQSKNIQWNIPAIYNSEVAQCNLLLSSSVPGAIPLSGVSMLYILPACQPLGSQLEYQLDCHGIEVLVFKQLLFYLIAPSTNIYYSILL
jgi:hypothetical protein